MHLLYIFLFFLLANNYASNRVEGLRAETIIDGDLLKEHTFKYIAALMYETGDKNQPVRNPCTAVIVGDSKVATAALCFFDAETRKILNKRFYIIVSTLNVFLPLNTTQYHDVDLVYFPRNYDFTKPDTYAKSGNLAVVKLNSSLGLQAGHRTLKKVKLDHNLYRMPNEEFIVSGFGWHNIAPVREIVNGELKIKFVGLSDGYLRMAALDLFSREDCQDKAIKDRFAPENICGKINQTVFERKGICEGDSGAPVVRGEYLVAIAIHSFHGCNENFLPGIYLSIPHYYNFIDNVLKDILTINMRIFQLTRKRRNVYKFEERLK